MSNSMHMQASNVFAGKHGLITPRDLFRWAERGADNYTQLAQHGYMLLAERLRSPGEAASVQDSLQRILKAQVSALCPSRAGRAWRRMSRHGLWSA